MKNLHHPPIGALVAVLLCYVQIGAAQTGVAAACRTTEVVNRAGWSIPGLRGARVMAEGTPETYRGIDNISVDALEPNRTVVVIPLASCVESQTGVLEVREQHIQVKDLLRYRKGRRVFGYKVTAVLMSSSKPHVTLASIELLYFYDPTGDGKFTAMRYASELGFQPIVPDWVKDLTGN